jgi:hypothetical protein
MALEGRGKGKQLVSREPLTLEIPVGGAAIVILPDGGARTITPLIETGAVPLNSELIGMFLWILSNDSLSDLLRTEFQHALRRVASGKDGGAHETLEKIKAAMRGEKFRVEGEDN